MRLKSFRDNNKALYPTYYNAPVNSFESVGGSDLVIVGLAPGLHGANQTGRPFTGDYAGDLLYATLQKFGFLKGAYAKRADDGLALQNCTIINAVRCVPPGNKPVAAEINNCLPFLKQDIERLKPKVILVLGLIAHNAVLKMLGFKLSKAKFVHNACHPLMPNIVLIDSYHCSRYNTNTGRLTVEAFESVFNRIREEISL